MAALAPKPVKPKRELSPDEIEFAQSLVIHRSKHALVLNKPPGLATQGGSKTFEHVDGLLDALQFEAESRPKLVHRLDRETSGILLVAKKRSALINLQDQFRERETGKTYLALVQGTWPANKKVIDAPLHKYLQADGERRRQTL